MPSLATPGLLVKGKLRAKVHALLIEARIG